MNKILIFWGLLALLLGSFNDVEGQSDSESIFANINAMPSHERHEALVAGARKEKQIDWYGSLLLHDVKDFIAAFNKQYPFLEIKYTRGGGTSLLNRALTEQRAGTPRVDVLSGRGNFHPTLKKAGFPAKYLAPFRKQLRDGFRDDDGYFLGQYAYSLVHAYNTNNVPRDRAPKSYQDLLRPEWEGQMVLDRQGFDWLAGIIDIMGEKEGLEFARKLAAQKVRLHRGHSVMTQLVAAGEFKVMIDGYHFQIFDFMERGAPLDFVAPDPMIVKEPSGVWLSRHSPHPHAAALLVDFLFSREGQQLHADKTRLVARTDIEWNFGGKTVKGLHVLSSEKWGVRYNELVKKFDEIFRQSN